MVDRRVERQAPATARDRVSRRLGGYGQGLLKERGDFGTIMIATTK
jgi:hypothetical protein